MLAPVNLLVLTALSSLICLAVLGSLLVWAYRDRYAALLR